MINSINTISFGKQYLGYTPVKNNYTNEKEDFDFVEYNNANDLCRIYNAAVNWQKREYCGNLALEMAHDLEDTLQNKLRRTRYYGLENQNGEIQAICEVITTKLKYGNVRKKNISQEIKYLEVNPDNTHGAPNRKYAKVGTSLFKEILKLAKQDEVKFIDITDISGGFWEKIPFLGPGHNDLVIWNMDYDKCIHKLDERI